jgi:CSLREA domain-containing protein
VSKTLRTALSVAMLGTAVSAQAAVFTVNSTADSGDGSCDGANCTLREAITAARDGDQILFSSLFNTPQTISLQTVLPDIEFSYSIQGSGANLLTVRRDPSAATNFRVFNLIGGFTVSVSISGMTITGGNPGVGQSGGGISSATGLNLNNVHVTGNTAGIGGGVSFQFADGQFTNCTFSNNSATNADGLGGGGIFYLGFGGRTLRIVNSTISGNRSDASGSGGASTAKGGGISFASFSGSNTLEIVNSTIANNTAVNASGIRTFAETNAPAMTTLRNTIVASNPPINLAISTGVGGLATFVSLGFNLSNDYNGVFALQASDITGNPLLGALQNNGGQTPTHAPSFGSPALDGGNGSGSITDQRGLLRPVDLPGIANAAGGNGSDIGAVEAQTLPESGIILRTGFEDPIP